MLRYRLRTLLAAVTIVGIALAAWLNWDALPGTYYVDELGFSHGTGEESYHYDNGKLKLKEWYYRGLIYRATWFKPDGTEIATEDFSKRSGGVGYYLHQDGSIAGRISYKYSPRDHLYLADGEAVFYAPDGTIERTEIFSEGSSIEDDQR